MAYLKKLFCLVSIITISAVVSYAQQTPVNSQTTLRNALNDSSDPNILLSGSFNFTSDLGAHSGKNAAVSFNPLIPVFISGGNQYTGFEFFNSTFTLTGSSSSTFTSFYGGSLSSGAVVNARLDSFVYISSVAFSSNTALSGGAFYSGNSVFNIAGSTFSNNTAIESGGAVFVIHSTGSLSKIFANGNTASGHGGFMFAAQSSFTIINSTISNNNAASGGGLSVSSSIFTLDHIYFADNSASSRGGALYLASTRTFSVSNSTFTGNSALSGGAAYMSFTSSGIMNNVYVTSNTADNGAGFYMDSSRNININNSRFMFNDAAQSGGALYISASTGINTNNVRFSSNSAAANGGAVFADNSGIALVSAYAGNNSANNGGAFYFLGSSAIIGNGRFENNIAHSSGGAFYMMSSSAVLNGPVFSGNRASSNGGAIYAENTYINIQNAQFNGNIAGVSGGAIYVRNSSAVLNNVSFSGNISQNGAAAYIDNSELIVNNGTFANNLSYGRGGAFYVAAGSKLVLNALNSDIKFEGNTDSTGANDIYLANNSALTLNAQNSDILLGGGIAHAASPSNISINKTGAGNLQLGGNSVIQCTFTITQGGVVLNESASLAINNLTVGPGNMFLAGRNSSVNVSGIFNIESGGTLSVEDTAYFRSATLNVRGNLSVGVDLKSSTSTTIRANTVNIDPSGRLLIGGNLSVGRGTFTIVNATAINGNFSVSSGAYGARINWALSRSGGNLNLFVESIGYNELQGLTHNQQQAANILNAEYDSIFANNGGFWRNVVSPMDALNLDDLKETLGALSGAFYADLFKSAAVNSQKRNMFGQIREKMAPDENSWVQASGSLLTFKDENIPQSDFEDTSWGIQAGWDLKNSDGLIGGLMIGYRRNDAEQENDKAGINSLEAGAYGAWFKNSFEFKGILSLGFQSYTTERKIKTLNTGAARGNFSGYSASFDGNIGYEIGVSSAIALKPFIGFSAAAVINESFNEEGDFGLTIASQNYLYSDALLGLGFKGYHKRVEWYINGGAGYALTGMQNELETEFVQADGKMKVKGLEQGDMILSANCGIEVTVTEQVYIYTHGGYASSDGYENISANAGLRYRF
ncbi:MAG: autotransporter domain-containing protein [Endomicrobia bacterium]|nr:autotransporter domain-containing protein [Endomicrobiia bacterium]